MIVPSTLCLSMTSTNRIILNPNQELAQVNYTNLLEKIIQVLAKENIFQMENNDKWLLIDINKVANLVATSQIDRPLLSTQQVRTATLNLSPGCLEVFPQQIIQISNCIQNLLKKAIPEYPNCIQKLITPLENFSGMKPGIDLSYNFTDISNLNQQRLTFENSQKQSKQALKCHIIKILVDKPRDFSADVLAGINNYINIQFSDADDEDIEAMKYIVDDLKENRNSDITQLQNLINKETLGKLKKLGKIKYLEYLLENLQRSNLAKKHEGSVYLQDLIRRLNLLEEHINDTNKADGEYIIKYADEEVNYQDIFSRGEAWDILPIITNIEGYLGETHNQNQDQIEFIFGLKLKLDGKVQKDGGKTVFKYHLNLLNPESDEHKENKDGGKTVFKYHLNLLNPESDEHKENIADKSKRKNFVVKILRTLILYHFVFASKEKIGDENYKVENELDYDPKARFEEDILPRLRGDNDEDKRELFQRWIKGFNQINVQGKIKRFKDILKNLIESKTLFPAREYPLHISVKQSILERDIDTINDNNTFFKSVLQNKLKECLKYINIGEATAQSEALVSLRGKITISELQFFQTHEQENFEMQYDIPWESINVLPVLFVPVNNNFHRSKFRERNLLIFPYLSDNSKLEPHQEFIYKLTYSLLTYICLYIVLGDLRLFIPILRIHLKEKTDDAPIEEFIVALTGVISHILNDTETKRSNFQGICVKDDSKYKYKISNMLTSMYSVLPKKFTWDAHKFEFSELDKLALIVVSSRGTDAKWGLEAKKSNLMGEIINFTINRKTVQLKLFRTFSQNYDDHQKMFEYPGIVVDNVDKLYKKGYRHFIYVAKVPYTNTLHITQTDHDNLFFMSQNVIKAFKKERDDIRIYPIFFDKYYVVKVDDQLKVESLYINDTAQLTKIVDDSSKQCVIFFNLFNGFKLSDDGKYNGVMSYATLLNIYKNIIDYEDIMRGLIFKDSKLKQELLQCLTLFHFYRYQKFGKNQHLKLDPYENLIGDKSVGTLAILKHGDGKVEFNCLAFLTYVRDILEVTTLQSHR